MAEDRIGTQITEPVVIVNPAVPKPSHYPNHGKGGYHSYPFLNDGTEQSVYGIKAHHREWNMLAAAGDTGITYKLIKGYFNADLLDNRNWKPWKIDNEETAIAKGGLSAWDAKNAPYTIHEFVAHNSRIWQSTLAGNSVEPGSLDPQTGEMTTAWKESSIDSLAHQRNRDTQLIRSNGTVIQADHLAVLANLTKTVFVSLEGNDQTGAAGRIDLPYRTVQAAINGLREDSMLTGQVIVLPGVYAENINQNGRHYLIIDLQGGAQLQGNLTLNGHALTLTSKDGMGVFKGKISSVYNLSLTLKDLLAVESNDVIMEARYGAQTFIEGVRRIYSSGASIFQGGNYFLKNIREIICDGGVLFNNLGTGGNSSEVWVLENIGLLWSKTAQIGQRTNFYDCKNVTFRSLLKNFHSDRGQFHNCRFISDTEHCVQGSFFEHSFKDCQFQSASAYAYDAFSGGKVRYQDTVRNCTHFLNPAASGIARMGTNNTYDSSFTINAKW